MFFFANFDNSLINIYTLQTNKQNLAIFSHEQVRNILFLNVWICVFRDKNKPKYYDILHYTPYAALLSLNMK